jgi:4,5-dihydroxyphthalate decarboxylase
MALDMSDRTLALHLGLVEPPPGVRVVYVPQATQRRHERMAATGEWDICEFSLASYLLAAAQGRPLRAVAVFPRRMFTAGLIFVHRDAGVRSPADLAGRRVGIQAFQTTACVWMIGDLATIHGVDPDDVHWVTERDEMFPYEPPSSRRCERMPDGTSLDEMLAERRIDAIAVPRIPAPARLGGPATRLFADARAEERRAYAATGIFPIMHTVVARTDVFDARPQLASELVRCFEASKRVGEGLYDDPNWSQLVDARLAFEEDRAWLGDDPYPYGLAPNRAAIERLASYEVLLRLIERPPDVAELFEPEA